MIQETQGERLIGRRDATEIEAREAPVKLEKPIPTPKPCGRARGGSGSPRASNGNRGMTLEAMLDDLPQHCSGGCKTNSMHRILTADPHS